MITWNIDNYSELLSVHLPRPRIKLRNAASIRNKSNLPLRQLSIRYGHKVDSNLYELLGLMKASLLPPMLFIKAFIGNLGV